VDDDTGAAHRQLKFDRRATVRVRVVAAQPSRLPARARNATEQCERDRVEHGRLAGAGVPVHEEQPIRAERVEVHGLGSGEWAERGDGQPVKAHRSAHQRELS